MTIRLRILPASDTAFQQRVVAAVAEVGPHDGDTLDGDLYVPSTVVLREALARVRVEYPSAWMRRQEAIAALDGVETWYAFRDAVPEP